MTKKLSKVLENQKAYYGARAEEYDEWFYRRGRYDYGPEHTRKWLAEVDVVRAALFEANLTGQVLDIAAGTGLWTQELLKTADHVAALDSSEEMLRLNRERVQSDRVTYSLTDLFYWQPVMAYDAVFMGFWLSHVPLAQLYEFLGTVVGALKEGGKVFFVDSLPEPSSTAKDMSDELAAQAGSAQETAEITLHRRLNDGRQFEIVKVFYEPDDLARRFQSFNIPVTIRQTDNFFLYGWGNKG